MDNFRLREEASLLADAWRALESAQKGFDEGNLYLPLDALQTLSVSLGMSFANERMMAPSMSPSTPSFERQRQIAWNVLDSIKDKLVEEAGGLAYRIRKA